MHSFCYGPLYQTSDYTKYKITLLNSLPHLKGLLTPQKSLNMFKYLNHSPNLKVVFVMPELFFCFVYCLKLLNCKLTREAESIFKVIQSVPHQ